MGRFVINFYFMLNKKITIIGAGNMGQAIVNGLLREKVIKPRNLILADKLANNLVKYKKLGITTTTDNKEACERSDIIILAVKPQILKSILEEIKNNIQDDQLIVSIAIGVSVDTIKKILGKKQPVARVMPNLCAQVGESMSAWVKSKEVSQIKSIKIILNSIGKEIQFKKEDDIDKATAISGSGPAYFFYLVELLEKSAVQIGINKKEAQILARQTLIGVARFLENSSESASQLRKKVTSKGGTTEAAFNKINNSKFEEIFLQAIKSAYNRAKDFKN